MLIIDMVEQLSPTSLPEQEVCKRKKFLLQRTTKSKTPVGNRWQDSHPIMRYIPLRPGEFRLLNDDLIVKVGETDPVAQTTNLIFEETDHRQCSSLNLAGVSIKDNVINVCDMGEFACRKIRPDGKVGLVASLDESIRLHGLKR